MVIIQMITMNNNKQIIIKDFIRYVNTALKIKPDYKIILTNSRNSDLKTHAYYNPNIKLIKIYIKDRHLADILRSIAHELVHHSQYYNGTINLHDKIQDIGGKIENDANALAGKLVKKFGYIYHKYDIYDIK